MARVLALMVVLSGASAALLAAPATAAPVAVTGSVVDATTGTGISGATVDAYGTDYGSTLTEPDGSFALALEPGSYDVEVQADGYAWTSVPVEITESTTEIPVIELQPLVQVTVTGTVVDADSSVGVADASVDAYGDTYDDYATTDEQGAYSLTLVPGSYDLDVNAYGYENRSVQVDVTEETTSLDPIALTPLVPGIHVSVQNDTLGGPATGAHVSLTPTGGGTAAVLTADAQGELVFLDVAAGDYDVKVDAAEGYLASEPVLVAYNGGAEVVDLLAEVDLSCEPASANQGLTNMGFESGLAGWTKGFERESISVVGADSFTSPWEGTAMARLGQSQPSSAENQQQGPNVLCQDFVVDQAQETFAFNLFTYDYTGFDEFRFDVVVTDPASGETLATYRQGAWGQGTELKTSGWRGVKLDLSDHVGETVRLNFRAGGTKDELFAFWTYLDSAATLPPTIETSVADVQSESGSVMTDPSTGQVTIAMPAGDPTDLVLTLPAKCESGASPTSVNLILDGTPYEGTLVSPGKYTMTVPQAEIVDGPLVLEVACDGETTVVSPIGQIVLYDPSGNVTDAVTGEPVVGAQVTLHKVPGWTPRGAAGPYPENSCETNESKGEAPWSQPAPTDLGTVVSAASPEISPHVNPFVTNAAGYYGWDVAEGCWYVTVEADGYVGETSPVVGVPSAVTDLHLELQPELGNVAKPAVSGAAKVGGTLTAAPGTWSVSGATFGYQWLRNGVEIGGATAASYQPKVTDVNASISVRVRATKAGYVEGSATSNAVKIPKIASAASLTLAKKKIKVRKTTTATVSVTVPAGGPATGTVVIKAGAKVVGSGVLSGGKVTIKLKKFKKKGKFKLVATYAGSATVAASVSKPVTLKVVR